MQTQNDNHQFDIFIDGDKYAWTQPTITGKQIKELAGVPQTYGVWQDLPGQVDPPVADGQTIDLREPGKEKFLVGEKSTNAGNLGTMLPAQALTYLNDKKIQFEEVKVGEQRALILRDHVLPAGKYDTKTADVLILLPANFPDAGPDMFYLYPWVHLVGPNVFPDRANVEFNFNGRRWQQWSRHQPNWRPGKDGIHIVIQRVEEALRIAHP